MARSMNDQLNEAHDAIRALKKQVRIDQQRLSEQQQELTEMRDQVKALQASRSKLSATLRLLCGDLIALTTESTGVVGWHKNGQIAAWDTFEGMMKIAHDYHDQGAFEKLGAHYMAEGIAMILDDSIITHYCSDKHDAEYVLLPDVGKLLLDVAEGRADG